MGRVPGGQPGHRDRFGRLPWLATSLTREPLLIALIGVAADLPWLLLSLPVGAIVDRADHRRVLTVTHWGRAVLVGAVAAALYTGRMSLAVLYVVAFVLGTLTVANENAAQTILPGWSGGTCCSAPTPG
nr:hypothetical protein GCM10020093_034460 [Planobispora longispora]